MRYHTVAPEPQDCVSTAWRDEILAAAEQTRWPPVLITPSQSSVFRRDYPENAVYVAGEQGWRVFVQMMQGGQQRAAQRLLMLLATFQETETVEA